jgi:hypothetical protein
VVEFNGDTRRGIGPTSTRLSTKVGVADGGRIATASPVRFTSTVMSEDLFETILILAVGILMFLFVNFLS